jgi:hypothetical protein
MSHTPGPWKSGGGLAVRYAGSDRLLYRYKVAESSDIDDAALIAAAPDLLAAARLALAWEQGEDCGGPGVCTLDVIVALRRAIAKAGQA